MKFMNIFLDMKIAHHTRLKMTHEKSEAGGVFFTYNKYSKTLLIFVLVYKLMDFCSFEMCKNNKKISHFLKI